MIESSAQQTTNYVS